MGEQPAVVLPELPEIKLFGKWPCDDVQVSDMSMGDYIAVKEKYAKYLPHSAGRYAAKRFRKAQCPIVERLTNSLVMHGRNNGKKLMAIRIIKHAFEIIHLLSGQNPLQVVVDAIINSGPREDSTRIGRAGTVRRQAVDVSPLRRVNQAIWLLVTGAREAAFRNIKTIAECLADELINAAKGSSNSYAIEKRRVGACCQVQPLRRKTLASPFLVEVEAQRRKPEERYISLRLAFEMARLLQYRTAPAEFTTLIFLSSFFLDHEFDCKNGFIKN